MNEEINLYNLLTKGSHKDIRDNLLNEVYKIADYCSTIIGEGSFGRVTIPTVGPFVNVQIGDERVILPIVVKETKDKGDVFIDEVNKTLIINSNNNITCEGLILFVLSKDWYKGLNLHLPFLIGMGSCFSQVNGVSHLVLERCGLMERVILLDENKYTGNLRQIVSNTVRTSFLSNIGGLIDYLIINSTAELKCILPNDITIFIPELIDNICIFYLHTCYYLWVKYGLTLGDQHIDNIFVHWINQLSRCGKHKINELESIYYEIGKNKFIKINTNKMIFKIGDIGISAMNIQNDVMICGNLPNVKNIQKVLNFKEKMPSYWDFILNLISACPVNFINDTIISKIIEKHNIYNKYVMLIGLKKEFEKNFPNELDILNDELYNGLKVDLSVSNNKNFTINLN